MVKELAFINFMLNFLKKSKKVLTMKKADDILVVLSLRKQEKLKKFNE